MAVLQAAESEAELRHQLKELTQQLQDSKEAHARTSSEHDLLTQQLSGRGLEAERVPDSPPGSPARKLQASLEELADLRCAILSFSCITPGDVYVLFAVTTS